MRSPVFARCLLIPALAGLILAAVVPAEAQYFGRNKVQYQNFDFRVMKTRHFDIYFYLEDEETVKTAALMAERWYQRLSRMFNHELKGRQPLILYASSPDFQQTTVISGQLGEGTGGVTESFKRRVILPYGATLGETDHVIGHELVHAFQYDLMSQGHSDSYRMNDQQLRIPLWFIEGMAEYLSIGPVDPHTAMWMRDAVQRKEFPTIKKLDNYKYFPYRYGHAFWSYVTGRFGDEIIGKMMKAIGRTGSYEAVIEGLLRVKIDQLSKDWLKSLEDAYLPLVDKTQALEKVGRTIVKADEMGFYNISPSISPDGRSMVFLSSRDLFSIDFFLADTETGTIERKLINTAIDPHFESIQFIRSAGSWDPTGEKFVFGAVSRGRPMLTILDIPGKRVAKEIPFTELAEILNPTWSPDGRFIAFSATAGGVSDIFIYELETDVLRQMTRDIFADIQPVWSPDGSRIAFVTERFSTNMAWLDLGNYELALLDPVSGRIEKVLAFPNHKNINPTWSPDSGSLYFLSDQNGKTDIYRIELDGGRIHQVTNLFTGISGITELSPAMSVAAETGRLVFSGYDEGRYSIYGIDDADVLAGQSFLAQFGENLAVLPPRHEPEGALLELLKNPLFGLPKDTDFQITAYKPKLALDYVSQPMVAIGADRYGTYGGGGVAAFWSDMLGYHTLVTMAQTSSRLIDTTALAGYVNSRRRLNWGAVLQRISYPYGYYGVTLGDVFGEPAYIETENIYRQINYDLTAFALYPFSQVQRVEFNLGVRYLQFNHTIYTRAYSLYGDYLILNDKESIPTAPGLALAYGSAALVYDSGIFGITSPILGQAYILQVAPTLGSINYVTAMADFRKYVMPIRPVTLAFRFMHYGRYGGGSEDRRLYPVYLGYWDMVRGYDSFTAEEYDRGQVSGGGFDIGRLYGSRMAMANFELRFPLLRVLGLGKGYYGAFPIEAFGFYDVGMAWWSGYSDENMYLTNRSEDPNAVFFGGDRKPISSTGFGVRTNLMGYLIVGVQYVYPISRPSRGWHFQLSISPGF